MENILKIVALGFFYCFAVAFSFGQTIVWTENFDNGLNGWSLNSGATGSNKWTINNDWGNSFVCPNTFFTPLLCTQDQSATTISIPNQGYLHIYATTGADGMEHALFNNSNQSAISNCNAISPSIPTTGFDSSVKLSFWWLCNGSAGVDEGKSYYSWDDGTTWIPLDTHHSKTTWQYFQFSLSDFTNQSHIKLKFNWKNGHLTGGDNDPPLAVDDIRFFIDDNIPPPPPLPDCSISGLNTVCTNESITLVGTPSNGTWNVNPLGIVTVANGVVTAGNTTGNVTITYSDASVCNGTATHDIAVTDCTPPGLIISDLSPDPLQLCEGYNFGSGTNIQINVTGTPATGNNYIVELSDVSGSFSTPTTIATLPSTQNGNVSITPLSIPSATLSGLVPGTGYKVRVRSTDPSETSNGTIQFIYHPTPTVTWNYTSPHSVCNSVTGLPLNATAIPSGGTFEYSGTGVSDANFNPSLAGVNTHTISVEYTSPASCKKTEELTIIVNDCTCDENNLLTSTQSTFVVCDTIFKIPDGTLSNIQGTLSWTVNNFGVIDDATSETPTLTIANSQVINYVMSASDECGNVSINVKFVPKPLVSIETQDPCIVPKQVKALSLDSLDWSTGDNGTALSFSNDSSAVSFDGMKNYFVDVSAATGSYWLKYTTISGSECDYEDSIKIDFSAPPSAQVQDDSICPGGTYQLFASSNEQDIIYIWNTGYIGNPLIVTEPGIYSVKGKNSCGESAESVATISLKTCQIDAIANVISLSSKNGNNIWFVPNDGAKDFECLIFNRWGGVVFELKNANEKWYGKDKSGNDLPEGVYFYKVTASYDNGKEETKHGFINLIH